VRPLDFCSLGAFGIPPLLKGFREQVVRPGVVLEYRKHGFPRGCLRDGRRGSSSRWACLHSERILGFVVMAPARETLLGWSMPRAMRSGRGGSTGCETTAGALI
jgi:hypothetical protein